MGREWEGKSGLQAHASYQSHLSGAIMSSPLEMSVLSVTTAPASLMRSITRSSASYWNFFTEAFAADSHSLFFGIPNRAPRRAAFVATKDSSGVS